jgi:ABC-type enterobactin transport system permease subunit
VNVHFVLQLEATVHTPVTQAGALRNTKAQQAAANVGAASAHSRCVWASARLPSALTAAKPTKLSTQLYKPMHSH